MPFSIPDLYTKLHELLALTVNNFIEMKIVGESTLSIKIDGKQCLTSIGVWPNGCCDVDFLDVSTERGEFKHFEFQDTEAALDLVFAEIILAVERG